MKPLTIKVTDELDQDISRAARRQRITKSELLRRAAVQYLVAEKSSAPFRSASELAGSLIGSIRGAPPDLASNPEHMEDYGK
jgi:hypothetical protein